ncbi:MAG TPA: cytochrome c oxidase subunit II [Planctomycetota bacterium]|jgi:cytochrome c oxidase subunit 2
MTQAGLFLSLLAESHGGFWFQREASAQAAQVDWLFYLVLYVSAFFFALIVILMLVFVVKYRRREGVDQAPGPTHNIGLEMVWMGIPIALVLFMFYQGFTTFIDLRIPPAGAMEIKVTGKQWFWWYAYPQNGYESLPSADGSPAELHVPPNEPIKLILQSDDVIHGFFIPAFRVKQDVVPGRYNTMWFTATQPGDYVIFCSVYCGQKHSEMRSVCIVHPSRADFDAWLKTAKEKTQASLTPAERGKRLYVGKGGCIQCHSLDGTTKTGPTFKDLYGHSVTLADGSKVPADENYLRESILVPGAKIVAGFRNEMPVFQGRLSDKEIDALIEFIKTQSSTYHPEGGTPEKKAPVGPASVPAGKDAEATKAGGDAGTTPADKKGGADGK